MTEHVNVDKLATERVLKARSELILARRFYGVLVSNVVPVLSRKYPTMATNSKQHFFNPDFIMSLTPAEVLGVQAHESEHDARHHGTRRNGRDPEEWNIACDYAINIDLIDEGFKLPQAALIDPKYRGMSAEDIYRCRELDKAKELPKPEPKDDEKSDETGEETEDETEGKSEGTEDDESDDTEDDTNGDSDGDGDDESEDTEDGDGSEDGESEDTEDEDGSKDGDGDGNGDGDDTGSETGNEPGDETGDKPGTGKGNGAGSDEGDDEGEAVSSGDPGGCGEVLDSAEDAADTSDQDHKWERVVRQAYTMAKAAGQLPGYVTRELERANNPPQDWRETLRTWFNAGYLRKETWNRPNRRFIGGGLYLPGNARDGVNKVAWLIDTSGSMDDIALALARNETQAALDDGVIEEVVVIYGDTQVTRVDTYRTGDEIEFDPRGGGGTILKPLFDHVRDFHDDSTLIVCFSDMMNWDWGDEPAVPVLFAITGYPDVVRSYMANTPWGAPAIDIGAH